MYYAPRASGSRGFTLIELLVVISIIAVLSSTVYASLNSARSKARDAKRVSEVKQLKTALELYATSNNLQYPASGSNNTVQSISVLQAALAPFMSRVPTEPLSAPGNYLYIRQGTDSYGIRVWLERSGTYCKTGQNIDTTWWGSDTPLCKF